MTSVPKPLKFLRPHYAQLQKIHASWPDQPPVQSTSAAIASTAAAAMNAVTSAVGITKTGDANGEDEAKKQDDAPVPASVTDKGLFADILSVLAMTYADSGKRETLMYRLKGGSDEDPGLWGHEYVR
jgi:26S proteasome regulatory subunit N1